MTPRLRKQPKSATSKKLSATVITHPTTSTNTNTDMNNTTSNTSDLVPVTSGPCKLPSHFAQLLRGNGPGNSGHRPLFKGNHELYYLFSVKLMNWIMIHDLEDFLKDDSDIDPVKNLCLFVLIIGCLDGDPLTLVSATAKGDGKRAFELLDEKYLGNFNARKCKHLNEVISLAQQVNEGVPRYISRVDVMIQKGAQFAIFNDTSYYVIRTLQGLLPRYEMFKTTINSNLVLPDWDEFKVRIQNHDQLHSAPKVTQNTSVMQVVASTSNQTDNVPHITKKKKVNFKKFVNKSAPKCDHCYGSDHNSANCNSVKFCNNCNNGSHNTNNCKRIRTQRGRGGRGGAPAGGFTSRGGGRGHHRGWSNARGNNNSGRGGGGGAWHHRGGGGGRGQGFMQGPVHPTQFGNNHNNGYYQNNGNYANFCSPMEEGNQFT